MSATIGRLRLSAALAMLAALVTSACASNSNPTAEASPGGPVLIAEVAPFSGPDADFGLNKIVGCETAIANINEAGGAQGHNFTCEQVDTRGDPADAVPAVQKLLGTTSNLVGVVGVTSDEALAVAPLINQASIPFFSTSGQTAFDHNTLPYFFRLSSPDDFTGYTMALWGHAKGYLRAAAIFGNDISSQGTKPTLTAALGKLGSPQIVISETVTLDQTSYRPEIQRLIAAQPDVIFSETDSQTAVTFFSELKQLNNGLIPFIGADALIDPTWDGPVAKAVGSADFTKYFSFVSQTSATSGTGYDAYTKQLLALTDVKNPSQYTSDTSAQATYDGVTLIALAMIASHSASPSVFTPWIVKLTQPKAGAVKVDTFAAGKQALSQGKTIQYLGLSSGTGGISFDQWHNSPGDAAVWYFPDTTSLVPQIVPNSPIITPSQVVSVEGS